MSYNIDSSLEFCEIINAFPVLLERLKQLEFKVDNITDGESMDDFFLRNGSSKEESNMIIVRLNSDLNYYLKKGKLPKSVPLRDEKEVLLLDEE
ncbi:MAG: hypothetical protein PF569_04470 [Candidatus Woesearchaeota archaeon]|jgi:antitoxin component YwqK of YwqJK toxin-antitoxin module|nr:hypothetical protein [Candidatus Woesearchaeota archaeon]